MRFRAALLITLVIAVSASAQQHPNQAKGFDPAKLYQFDSIDSINQFNGNLVLTIPIGQKYPVSSALSYGFTLVYNGNAWDWSWAGATTMLSATPSTRSNAGLGWLLSLGRLIPPEDPSNETHPIDADYQHAFVYEGSDGADHTFGNEGVVRQTVFALDDSNLRLTLMATGTQRVEFPDGTYQTFVDRPAGVPQTNPDWRLTQMADRFGNYMQIAYSNNGNTWTVTDSTGRTHVLQFHTATPPEVTVEQTVLDSITVATFGSTSATYYFSYANVAIDRPSGDNSGLNHVPGGPYTMKMLIGVALPNGESYSMMKDGQPAYDTAGTPAMLRALRLPTMGRLEWDWAPFDFPEGSSLLYVKLPDYPPDQDEDLPPPSTHKTAVGVVERRKFDETNKLLGAWQYAHLFSSGFPLSGINFPGEPCTSTTWDPVRVRWVSKLNYSSAVMSTILVEPADHPAGSADDPSDKKCLTGCPITVSYYSVYPHVDGDCGANQNPHHFTNGEYGLPLNRYIDSDNRYLSVQNGFVQATSTDTWQSLIAKASMVSTASVIPNLVRSRYAAFDDAATLLRHYETASRTFNSSADSCSGTGCEYTETFNRMYDERRPKLTVSGGTVGGQTHYKATYTAYTPMTNSGDPDTPWILTPYTEKCTVEYGSFPGSNGEPSTVSSCASMAGITTAAASTMETACFDSTTGYLSGRRVLKSPPATGAGDVSTFFNQSSGNTTGEAWFGGDGVTPPTDLCTFPTTGGTYRYSYAYDKGSLSEAKTLLGSSWLYTVKQTIDPNTGLVSKSTDAYNGTSGFDTAYAYNSVGQLTGETPDKGATTEYHYTIANGTASHAAVDVIKHPQASTSSVLTKSTYTFDALGRIIAQSQLMPSGDMSTQTTTYLPRGLKWKVSELEQTPQHFTVFEYDSLGRMTKTTAPDATVTSYAYSGATSMTRTSQIATTHPVTSFTNADTTETYDAFGRVIKVQDGVDTIATYTYDVMDHLSGVAMGVQSRSFTYDARGFLTRESHPESGEAVNSGFDAKGHATTRQVTGGPALTFAFDGAERVTRISDASHTLKEYVYDSVAASTEHVALSTPGRLLKTIRHNWLPADRKVTEYFTYDDRLLLQSKETVVDEANSTTVNFKQPVSHDDLGFPDVVTYPTTTDAAAAVATPSRTVSNVRVNGMLTEVTGYTKANRPITYAENGTIATITHANGVTDTVGIDPNRMKRPSSISFVADLCPAPAFTAQAQPASVTSGFSARIVVTPTDGALGNTYEWFEGSTADPASSTSLGSPTPVSYFETGALTQTRSFWVRVTSACGKSANSSVITIQVTDATCATPNITTQPVSPGTVTAGTVVHLTVGTNAGTPAYQWYANGSPVPGGTNSSLDYQVNVTTSFYATVSTCATTPSNTVTALVNAASTCPQPVVTTSSTSIWLGQSVTLSTDAQGNQFEWHQGIQGVYTSDTPVPESQGGHSSSITVRPQINAVFWVYVTSPCRSQKSDSVTVDVVPPPGGDLNSDGRTDFVWRNYTTGDTWIADGYSANQLKVFYGTPLMNPDWHINGFDDVDGDYYPDLIWHNNATGANTLWSFAADPANPYATPTAKPLPAITTNNLVDPDWRLVGVADLDGTTPRRAELFFRNYRTGDDRVIWPSADGSSITSSIDFQSEPNLDWKIVGVIGYDGTTRKAKVVWRNTVNGQNRLWYLEKGTGTIGVTTFSPAPPTDTDQSWQIEGAGDFEGIGGQGIELAWRNQTSGTVRLSKWDETAWREYFPGADGHADARIQLGGDFDACVTPTVTISASGPLTICSGSVRLTASGTPSRSTSTYRWSTGAVTSFIDVSASGTYTVTVTSPEGCAASASVRVTAAPAATPVITASNGATGTIDITSGDQVVLTSSSAKSYAWSNGATTSTISTGTAGTYSVTTTDSNDCAATSASRQVVVHPRPPSSVTATASLSNGAYRVTVSWVAPPNTNYTYMVQRSTDGHTFTTVTSNPDTSVVANTTYIYRVFSYDGTLYSLTAPMDLATTIVFTNDPLVRGVTPVSLVHVTEIRTAINSVRAAAGLAPATWTSITAGVTPFGAAHINELRTRLNEALVLLASFDVSLGPPPYTDSILESGMPIRLEHLQQLRERVK